MAQIAEDLFLLLLDNASAQPGLDRSRRERVLSAAVLLDLAHACRIRPAMDGELVETGRLVALAAPGPMDPVVATAVKRLSRHTETNLANYLEYMGQIRRVRLNSRRCSHPYAWPLTNRERVGHARSALLSALFDRRPPAPPTAAIISLLHAVDGLGALLSLNDRGWRGCTRGRVKSPAAVGWTSIRRRCPK